MSEWADSARRPAPWRRERLAAAPALGGVQIGTAYLLCPEAIPKSCACAALKSAASRRTALIHLFTGDLRVAL
jgi:NAD(P)H-dependent flavin oxidoreductase YrpB (nitropropane dioxygenase family)